MKVGAAMTTETEPDERVKNGPVWVKANKQENILFFKFIYLFLRERAQAGEGQREGDTHTESEAGSRL